METATFFPKSTKRALIIRCIPFITLLYMKTIRDICYEIALKAHQGQYRSDGKEYITHPLAVEELFMGYNPKYLGYFDTDIIRGLCLVHDVPEDTSVSEEDIENYLADMGIDAKRIDIFIEALRVLNKNNHDDYCFYILACKRNPYSSIVKGLDLKHNMSDLPKGTRKDKYRLAEQILSHYCSI